MFLAFNIADIVRIPFGWILAQLYHFTTNYGVAIILFALIVKVVLLPLTAKGKKSMMKMSRLTPRVQALQKKYADDQQRQSQEIQKLYKEEKVSMGGGCLWSFLPILVLIPLYTVVRQPITYMLQETNPAGFGNTIAEFITGASAEKDYYIQMTAAQKIPEFWEELKAAGHVLKESSQNGVNFSFLGFNLASVPAWKVWNWDFSSMKVIWQQLGAFLMPVLSAAGALVSMLISQKQNNSLVTNEKGLEDKETVKESQTAQQGKMMMWVSPIMSLFIGFNMPAALSLYWFAQGIFTTVSDIFLTRHYRKVYDAEDAERLKKALAEEAAEEEKERIRAERRAANPDGITTNTSKKKMQQNKQREQEAAKAAAAKEYAAKKEGLTQEEAPQTQGNSGIAARPNCRGRAYDPNRYSNETTEEK